jgi:type 2 lantibiotic biosynthesis protein LanM
MNQSQLQDSAWYSAVTLRERIAALRRAKDAKIDDACEAPSGAIDFELAERRLQRWRSQAPFEDDSYFQLRLEMDGIDEDEFRRLLGEPVEAIRERFSAPPEWLIELSEAFFNPAASEPIALPVALRDKEGAGFLRAIEPLINHGRNKLRHGIEPLIRRQHELPFNPATIDEILFPNLAWQLLWILTRTMVLELNVARLQERLRGDTPEERFESFLEQLGRAESMLEILRTYPVLARQLVLAINKWANFSTEFLRHLCDDWNAILSTFKPESEPGQLTSLKGGISDMHRGGRTVLIAEFGGGFKVVYKPKSLAVDVHFQELLAWLNERGSHPPFRLLKNINRGSYGWVEFISPLDCDSPEEVRRFYRRQGGYLALLYALEATDFHFENLIATGEHPMLIDLESLFHPRIGETEATEAHLLATNKMSYSVLRVMLLPQRRWADEESAGIDVSGLGALAGQLTPDRLPSWQAAGTDRMRMVRKRVAVPAGSNRPTLNGAEVNVLGQAVEIIEGFTSIYQLLLKHREELLVAGGPLATFAEDEVRALLRPTRTYGLLLHESFHPDVLRNALDRERLFDRLWLAVEPQPYLKQLIRAEHADLLQGDIPMFTTRPGSHDLRTSDDERIPHFFKESGLALVRSRIEQLSEQDLAQQVWFVRASLTTLFMEHAKRSSYTLVETEAVADREQLIAAARSVGERLDVLALRGENDATWLGLTLTQERYWSLAPLSWDLYVGLPGVVLFLAYLGALTHEERFTQLAQSALRALRQQLEHSKASITSIGGFSGWGGLIYLFTHLGVLWQQPTLLAEAEEMAIALPPLIEKDDQLDVLGGAAGCLMALVGLCRRAPSERTLAAALQCGEKIIASAQQMEHGVAWKTGAPAIKPLAGFSHGAAGIACALLELSDLTGEERFRLVAREAITYERSLFSTEAGNWPDLREPETSGESAVESPNDFITAWCHGAAGIGLARLRSLRYSNDGSIREEIDVAIKTTLEQGFGHNHSLCHGDLGNLDVLMQAAQILDDQILSAQVKRFSSMILESINRDGWLCGTPLGVESPGLMIGLAGIGYGLLRLAEPLRVPSILALAPPPSAQTL